MPAEFRAGVLKRRERIGKAARTGDKCARRASPPQDGPPYRMTAAVLFAFASASLLGAGVVTAQFGLRTVEPLSGAAISVPSFHAAVPAGVAAAPGRRARGLARPADLRRHRAGVPGDADASDLCLQPRAGAGRHLDARQSRAAVRGGAGRRPAARAAARAAIRRPGDRGRRRRDHHRHPAARLRRLAKLGAAAAARQRAAARRGAADRQAWARDLAEPALGLPDRLCDVVARRADASSASATEALSRKRHGRAGSGSPSPASATA